MAKVFLEVALNGPWSRKLQPLIPVTTAEIIAQGIACARLGASVIHTHVYDPDTGRQVEDFDAYRAVIEGIRAECDVIVYPTLPLSGSPDAQQSTSPKARFAVVERLARAGLLEWAVVDPGSAVFASFLDIAEDRPGYLYANSEAEVRHGLALAVTYGFHPSYAIYEPGFLRLGAALAARYPGCPRPIYRLMFSDGFSFGFPPRPYAVEAYLALLDEVAPGAIWMIAGLQVGLEPILGLALARGGHLRVGLEDAPFHSKLTNAALTEAAVSRIARLGHSCGSALELRRRLTDPPA